MNRRTIVVAPDKFKGSLSALEVGRAIERGLKHVLGERHAIAVVPMADGGEGTVAAFVDGGAAPVVRSVRGPLGERVDAVIARDGDVVILEMASASGLALLSPEARGARDASTYGTGELIRAALDIGARRIVVGIGGSATNDGGAGMLAALGVRLLDAEGEPIPPGGMNLSALRTLDISGLDARLHDVALEVAADVDNPLCGPTGATTVFGPQKGASPEDVPRLDSALAHFADQAASVVGRDYRDVPGAGAAGGLGFGLMAFLGARLRPGVDIVAELRGLDEVLQGALLCISGEGRIDEQTLRGKTVAGVANIARRYAVPVIALGGTLEPQAEDDLFARGITCFPILDKPMTLEVAVADAEALVQHAASRVARVISITPRT
ncbi:MAG: glycerate kinase [Candidatus Eremiobacteraeota bacterium]|nr:glycerate kinase [Candidatus Eremiobacteraeota bacterium]